MTAEILMDLMYVFSIDHQETVLLLKELVVQPHHGKGQWVEAFTSPALFLQPKVSS